MQSQDLFHCPLQILHFLQILVSWFLARISQNYPDFLDDLLLKNSDQGPTTDFGEFSHQ
jgi:hypothetical protein